ncbi:hypothetical protein L1049_018219 [Liquidambar formosana]|uniref:Uncharacterized protein n=1 Tax=Liquidambar formosana TaxID=63359 RepID=A0AAP0R9Q9_LIQFO
MPANDGVRFTSSSLKIPIPPNKPTPIHFVSQTLTSHLTKTKHSLIQLITSLKTRSSLALSNPNSPLLCSSSLSLTRPDESTQDVLESGLTRQKGWQGHVKSSLLCSASLALTRSDEPTQGASEGGAVTQQKVGRHGREDEERVLISEVLVPQQGWREAREEGS